MEEVLNILENVRRGGYANSSFLLPLAPGCLVRGRITGTQVKVSSTWVSLDDAIRECTERLRNSESAAERECEKAALQSSSEEVVRAL